MPRTAGIWLGTHAVGAHGLRAPISLLALCSILLGPSATAAPPRSHAHIGARIDRLLDRPPFDRGTWAVIVSDSTGRVLYERNADRLMIPASNNKLLVTATALALLGPTYRVTTSVYSDGPLKNGVLNGNLIVYGRGDPTFSAHCYGPAAPETSRCDSLWTGIDALVDSLIVRGVRRVKGALVGDGSCFEPHWVHDAWEQYDLNWWYAAPVSGLGFNDNCVDIAWKPGARPDAPAVVTFEPHVDTLGFENRSRTTPAGTPRTLDFYRHPGTLSLWAEGTVPIDDAGLTEYFALPDPNLYFASALRLRLARRGVSVSGPTLSTTDSLRYRGARRTVALASRPSRPVSDLIFPILNSSHNWFAEMLLKVLGNERGQGGSWTEGLRVERRFLIDSVGVDSTAFATVDASGLAKSNLVTARALTQILRYARTHAGGDAFVAALPRSGRSGSLRRRFTGTTLDGRVVAKTGTVDRVNSLSGYVERPRGGPLVFSVIVNNYAGSRPAVAQIDSVVVEMAR